MTVAEEVIDAFGGLTKMARVLNHKHVTTIDGWRRSGTIPPWRYNEILTAAVRAEIALPESFLKLTAPLVPESQGEPTKTEPVANPQTARNLTRALSVKAS
jgi:hypothetical protein